MTNDLLIGRFRAARKESQGLAVLEGLHAVKHAMRFDAEIELCCVASRQAAQALMAELAPDLCARLDDIASEVDEATFAQLAPKPPKTGIIAIARRPVIDVDALLEKPRSRPIILLEAPTDLGNVGAVVRLAAAAGAGAVLVTGEPDPWHPAALRGSAGLHFALPVARIGDHTRCRPLMAVDCDGAPLDDQVIPGDAVLAFGSERRGLSPGLLQSADVRLAIPMRHGVSSLNLAVAAGIVVYHWRLRA